jgi:uncharacterized membrane protein HdeD (DUF308 family)
VEVDSIRWSSVLLRGIAGVIFGIVLLAWPQATVGVALWVFGVFAIVAGLVGGMVAFSDRHERQHWVWSIVGGLASIVIGIIVLANPHGSAKFVLFLIAIMAIIWGLSDLFMAVTIRKEASAFSVWMLVLAGLISFAFGLYALIHPGNGAVAIIWLIGIYAIAWGLVLVLASFAIRAGQRGGSGPAAA